MDKKMLKFAFNVNAHQLATYLNVYLRKEKRSYPAQALEDYILHCLDSCSVEKSAIRQRSPNEDFAEVVYSIVDTLIELSDEYAMTFKCYLPVDHFYFGLNLEPSLIKAIDRFNSWSDDVYALSEDA